MSYQKGDPVFLNRELSARYPSEDYRVVRDLGKSVVVMSEHEFQAAMARENVLLSGHAYPRHFISPRNGSEKQQEAKQQFSRLFPGPQAASQN